MLFNYSRMYILTNNRKKKNMKDKKWIILVVCVLAVLAILFLFLNSKEATVTFDSANEGAGLYLPNAGTTKISGGKITAGTVLNIKSGSLEITAGEFKAIGAKKDPTATTGQNNNTGYVIIIEENASYQDHVIVNITGGTFESVNGYIIQEYNPTLGIENELTSVITGLYTVKNNISENTFYYTMEE